MSYRGRGMRTPPWSPLLEQRAAHGSRAFSAVRGERGQQQLCQAKSCVVQRAEEFLRPFRRKYKAVPTMARRELPPELLQEIRDLAAGWGKIVARRAFGDGGPGLDTDFEAMEQLARAAAVGLTEGALAT